VNTPQCEAVDRSLILRLWWLKARRATSGQNNAAARAARNDGILTVLNIFVPAVVFAFGLANSVAHFVDTRSSIHFVDVVTIATGFLLACSSFQFASDYKRKAIEHREASNEFDAVAQAIESTGFVITDPVAFHDIAGRLERARRASWHVGKKDWKPARKRYEDLIEEVRAQIASSIARGSDAST
jgi:hypothetical protein